MGTREDLVQAAADLMDAGGLEAVTLRDVGKRAGVSHNAPYKHFADKEALLAAVAARELNLRGSTLRGIVRRSGSAGQALRQALHSYVRWALAHPVRFKLIYGKWTTETPELTAAALTTRGLLFDIVSQAQSDGDLPKGDPEQFTMMLLALAHGAVDLSLAGHLTPGGKGTLRPTELVDKLLTYLTTDDRALR
jgi:AcrR family transcriptional regulator